MKIPSKITTGVKSSIQLSLTIIVVTIAVGIMVSGFALFGYGVINPDEIEEDSATIELTSVSGSEGSVSVDTIYSFDELSEVEQNYTQNADTSGDEIEIEESPMPEKFEDGEKIGVNMGDSVHVYTVDKMETDTFTGLFFLFIGAIIMVLIGILIIVLMIVINDIINIFYQPFISILIRYM